MFNRIATANRLIIRVCTWDDKKISVRDCTTFTQSAIKPPLPGFKASDQYSNGQYSNIRTVMFKFFLFPFNVEKILKGSLDFILSPSSSVKIQIMGGKVYFR